MDIVQDVAIKNGLHVVAVVIMNIFVDVILLIVVHAVDVMIVVNVHLVVVVAHIHLMANTITCLTLIAIRILA